MKNYKRYLLYNIVFLLSEIKFMIFHLRTLNLNELIVMNKWNEFFKGDDKK